MDIPELPLEPPEPGLLGYCLQCGGEIYAGKSHYNGSGGLVHEDCMGDYILDCVGVPELAARMGYRIAIETIL